DRTDIDTSGVFHAYSGLSNDTGHLSFLLSRTFSLLANRLAQVNKIYVFPEAYLDRSFGKCYTRPTQRREMSRKLSRIHVPRLLLAIAFIALGVAFPVGAATIDDALKNLRSLSPAQREAVIEENARKEREVVWYTSMSLTDFPKIVGAFEKTVPYVKVRASPLTQSTVMTKIDTEARAGLFAVDIVGSAPVEMWELKQRGHSAPYLSPELKAFPAGSYDPQGFWSSFEVTPIVLAFNTKLVSQEEAPRSYQDLLQPKWKGKMNMGNDEYAWYSVMLDGMGKAKGLDYMKALARQQLHIPGSSSIMRLQLMLAGESAITLAARGR